MSPAPFTRRRPPSVRAPILAGRWYPENPEELLDSVREHLAGSTRPSSPPAPTAPQTPDLKERVIRGLIVPHAGHVYSGACAGASFRWLARQPFRRVILLGPSHFVPLTGAVLPVEDAFATPLGALDLDHDAVESLKKAGIPQMAAAHRDEHCLEIELPFLQVVRESQDEPDSSGYRIVPLLVGRLDEGTLDATATALAPLWDDETLLLVSTDFTHFGPNYDYIPFYADVPECLERLDGGALTCLRDRDEAGFAAYLEKTGITICGAEPLRLLLRLQRDRDDRIDLVDYYRSGDYDTDYGVSVSYAALLIHAPKQALQIQEDEAAFLRDAARSALEWAVGRGPDPEETLVPSEIRDRFGTRTPLLQRLGCFVTLHDAAGELRGCIGTLEPDRILARDVAENAVAAAMRDPRFPPLRPAEVEELAIEISVLTPHRRIESKDEIVIGRHGVLLRDGIQKSVFLPVVAAEQGWDVSQLLEELRLKAGLPSRGSETEELYVFESLVLGPREPS